MATSLERSLEYTVSPADFYRAITTEAYWTARLEEIGGENVKVNHITLTADSVDVSVVQSIPADRLPPAVTAIRKGDLEIIRIETWRARNASSNPQATGTFSAEIVGAPAKLEGVVSLAGADRALLTASGKAEVKIPFIGGKIEATVIENLTKLMEEEREFTQEWIAANPA